MECMRLSAGAMQFVRCREVVRSSECPLWEVPLYMYIYGWKKSSNVDLWQLSHCYFYHHLLHTDDMSSIYISKRHSAMSTVTWRSHTRTHMRFPMPSSKTGDCV